MNRKVKHNRIANYVSLLVIVVFFGCSIQKNHKVLTFFFDGVDQMAFVGDNLSHDSLNRDAIQKREDALKKNRPDKYVHMPFKERKCDNCHTPDKHLQKPVPELCYKCHKNFAETVQFVHGPVASGQCLKCHHQHYSAYPKLLLRPGQQVCTYCHSTDVVFKARYHRDIEDLTCTTCHNPHGGNNKSFLWDRVAKGFKGQTILEEMASHRLTGQLYSKVPGDIGAGIPVQILNENGEVAGTAVTDSTGKFSMVNMHPNNDYNFKFVTDSPEVHVGVLDYKNQLVANIDRGRKGRFNFDKEAYETAHGIVAVRYGEEPYGPSGSKSKTADSGIAKSTKPATTGGTTDTSGAVAKAEPDTTKPVAGNAEPTKAITEPTTAEEPKTAGAPNKEQPADKGNTATSGQTDTVTDKTGATTPAVSQQRTGDSGTAAVPTLGGTVNINPTNDFTDVKLSGRTFRFQRGTVVCILDQKGAVIAIAKVAGDGNFVLDRPQDSEKDTSLYSQILFLNYDTNEPEFVRKNSNNQHVLVPGTADYTGGMKIDNLKTLPPPTFESLLSVVYYSYGSSELSEKGLDELDRVITFLDNNPDVGVKVNAYTDARGSTAGNQKLSERRAKAVMTYLVSQGIDKNRIITNGFGESNPVNKCTDGVPCTEAEHAQNRRVEILISDK